MAAENTVRIERGQLDALTAAIREVAAEVRELRAAWMDKPKGGE